MLRRDLDEAAGDLVEVGLGLANTDLARFDDVVEPRHHLRDVGSLDGGGVVGHDVVRETRGRIAGCDDSVEGHDHLGSHRTREQRQDIRAWNSMAECLGLVGEGGVEACG